jgi:hypothetical protein
MEIEIIRPSESQTAEQWLDSEHISQRSERLRRLGELQSLNLNHPEVKKKYGLQAYYLLNDAQTSYVYGQFLASFLCSMAYLDNILAQEVEAREPGSTNRLTLGRLITKAKAISIIDETQQTELNGLCDQRNDRAHYRAPFEKRNIEGQILHNATEGNGEIDPEKLAEKDAKKALSFLAIFSINPRALKT